MSSQASSATAFAASVLPGSFTGHGTNGSCAAITRRPSTPRARLLSCAGESPPAAATTATAVAAPAVSRRALLSWLVAAPCASLLSAAAPARARAENMSALLTVYKDLPKGFTILRPSGWNEFEAMQGNYDMKWQDVIQTLEFVTVLTSPVSKDKRLADLGAAKDVGTKLAASRGGELVAAVEKDIDGIPAYVFEIKKDKARQITLLTVNKMKLYSVNASCSQRRWNKREKLLRIVVDSFKPKL